MHCLATRFLPNLKDSTLQLSTNKHLVTSAAAAAVAGSLWYLFKPNSSGIKQRPGWPLIGQWLFFTKRHDFLKEGFNNLPDETLYRFNVLKHQVIALRGEEARRFFFERNDLNLSEGYRLLFGGGPDVRKIVKEKSEQEKSAFFHRRILSLFKVDRLADLAPSIMSDIERNMETWGETGQLDPFDVIYSVVFQLIIRTAGAREISDSVEKCKVLERLYWRVEMGSTPTSILFPWVPSTARKQKDAATREIYLMFDELVKARQSEDRREEDALQLLMDLGDSTPEIIALIMGVLFVAIVNTGLIAAWILIFLDQEPEWKDKVIQEVQTLLDQYVHASQDYGSISEGFSTIPLEAWENETPVLEACLRETIRLVFTSALLRRVVSGDLDIEGKKISNGSFLVYLAGETHSNPDIYPNPNKFDPSRYAAGQDKSQAHAYLGWGAGRHPCLGKRFAQYEVKVICALFLTVYDYEVVDVFGRKPDSTVTVPDRNNIYQASIKYDCAPAQRTKLFTSNTPEDKTRFELEECHTATNLV